MVVCDDVSMPFGQVKISLSPGTAGHHGVEDVANAVGKGFLRYRVGVGFKPHPEMLLREFVLSPFSDSEGEQLEKMAENFVKNLEVLVDKERGTFMNGLTSL
jgi:PTH1 family peptidyl-tRNA hydrolase